MRVTQHTFALCHNISESTETESDNRQFAQSDCDHRADKTNQEENKHAQKTKRGPALEGEGGK